MYFKNAVSKQYKIWLRTYRSNNYYCIQKANIFTGDTVALKDTKVFLQCSNKPQLKGIQSRYEYARKLLIDNLLKRVTNTLAADLRRRAVRQLFNGNPSPFFALVGVSLASGTGIINKEDEFEGVCREIRESMNRMRINLFEAEESELQENYSLNSLEFGSVIAKGSNAVVYEAREKCKAKTNEENRDTKNEEYPLAVKMMFNYDAESNAFSILRSMYKEMVPLQNKPVDFNSNSLSFWERETAERIQCLPPHPHIVVMYRSFADYVPDLPDSLNLYPDALPTRLNPKGYGRNMSLFLVMKKYNTNLQQYLTDKTPDVKDGILLLTQLLEAITHMNRNEIAHRDLKSDNILLDTSDGDDKCPGLVVTDFGCCLSDRNFGLSMPYKMQDIDKGGNAALMAPEVINAKPGMFSAIDYSKSDAWTAGAIGYEIFTGKNPFYAYGNREGKNVLRNVTYTEDMLPELPNEVPYVISQLIRSLLVKNPSMRLDAELAATICQLQLWAPSQWLISQKIPSNNEILQWLLSLTTKVLYEGLMQFQSEKSTRQRPSATEYKLIATFLQRIKLGVIRKALNWVYNIHV